MSVERAFCRNKGLEKSVNALGLPPGRPASDRPVFQTIWCCQCQTNVQARLTTGAETYPHRPDLADLPRWFCDVCRNHVGTHHKTSTPTKPLGNIPSPEIKRARIHIHALIDPAWKSKRVPRGKIYAHLSSVLGREYHTAELRTVEECRAMYAAAKAFLSEQPST